jgi:hypothetical protein
MTGHQRQSRATFDRHDRFASVAQILVQSQLDAQLTVLSHNEPTANRFGKPKVYQSPLNLIREAAQRGRYRNDF